MITPKVITGPSIEPVTTSEAKLQCRIDGSTEDSLIDLYIGAAREYYEWRTSRTLHQQTLEYVMHCFPGCSYIQLPRATPLISVTSVIYYDSTGSATTLPTSTYIVDTDSEPGGISLAHGESWPSFESYPINAVRIRYVAGIAATSPVTDTPDADKFPILLLVGGMYENRESIAMPDRNGVEQIALMYGVEPFIARRTVEYVF
jgi:uncharacterized phiE125 gp8 family phage protein